MTTSEPRSAVNVESWSGAFCALCPADLSSTFSVGSRLGLQFMLQGNLWMRLAFLTESNHVDLASHKACMKEA